MWIERWKQWIVTKEETDSPLLSNRFTNVGNVVDVFSDLLCAHGKLSFNPTEETNQYKLVTTELWEQLLNK